MTNKDSDYQNNITLMEQLQRRISELEDIERQYSALFNRTNDAVFLIDLEGNYKKVNHKTLEMLGYDESEIIGKPVSFVLADSELKESDEIKNQLLKGDTIPIYERVFKRKDGSTFIGENDVTLVRDQDGNPLYFFSIVRDVTKKIDAFRRLKVKAETDPLTKLFNRRSMIEKLEHEKNRYERNKNPFVVVLSDIDNFKLFNDSYGHDCGDFVLKAVSDRILTLLRKQDVASRWGGEEFLFLLPDTDLRGGLYISEKICRTIANDIFEVNGQKLTISLTFGVVEFDENSTIESCIKNADKAMYMGKHRGKNCVVSPA